jgi:signal transduction histidine kinase
MTGTAPQPAGDSPSSTWRDDALKSMLSVAALVAPPASILAAVVRPAPRPWVDSVVIMAVGLAMPALRFAPRIPFGPRAAATMTTLFVAGVFALARTGLAPGVSLLFAVASIFGAMYFGRAVGFASIGLGSLAFLVIGWLVTRGHLRAPADMFDPRLFQNWFRVGMIYALIASLLTSTVTFVIGRVESSARDLRVAYERLGQLHLRLESTKEEERRFLARELHDEFGQLLTALKLRTQLGMRGAQGAAAGADELDTIAVIDDLISRVRRMSGDLRPALLDEVGLVPALRAYLDTQAAISGVAMTLETQEPPPGTPRLDGDLEITCFRIVQEAVTNAIRHAAARDLRVQLDRRADRVALRIRDDGRGFDVAVRLERAAAAGHLGVVGMRERVRTHGGGFRLDSRPGAGTIIEVELPLAPPGLGGAVAVPS